MPIKLYPMPKIDYLSAGRAYSCGFIFMDYIDSFIVDSMTPSYPQTIIRDSKTTFEQAVTAWVEQWVRNNFEPIVVPENKKAMFNQDDHVYHRIDGWNDCVRKLLELNPNAIRSEG